MGQCCSYEKDADEVVCCGVFSPNPKTGTGYLKSQIKYPTLDFGR